MQWKIDIEVPWKEPTRLGMWLLHDYWTAAQGILLLTGIDPHFAWIAKPGSVAESIRPATDIKNLAEITETEARLRAFQRLDGAVMRAAGFPQGEVASRDAHWFNLHRVWESSGRDLDYRAPPSWFRAWSESKGWRPEWHEWAEKEPLNDAEAAAPEARHGGLLTPHERVANIKTTKTLLILVAAAFKTSGREPGHRKTAGELSRQTSLFSAEVKAATIRKTYLNEIPGAISSSFWKEPVDLDPSDERVAADRKFRKLLVLLAAACELPAADLQTENCAVLLSERTAALNAPLGTDEVGRYLLEIPAAVDDRGGNLEKLPDVLRHRRFR